MRSRHRFVIAAASVALATYVAILYAARRIERTSVARIQVNLADLPHQRIGLVLGCAPVLRSGAPNLFFEHRIEAAAAAFRAQKLDYLLVSGDNHIATYDEPTAMKDALVKRGVPAERIALDYAGFSTFDSIVRAKRVFGLREFCVITQRDHALRALYIAKANGIAAVAYPAKDVPVMSGLRTGMRESLARVRTLLDVHVWDRKPRFLGPRVEIVGKFPHSPASG